MLKKEKEERMQMEMICMDELVPEDHLLRKIDDAMNLNRIYDLVEDLYCHKQRQTKYRSGSIV